MKPKRCLDCRWCRLASVYSGDLRYYCARPGAVFHWTRAKRKSCRLFSPRLLALREEP